MKSPLKSWVRALEMTAPIAREPLRTLPIVIEQLAERFTDQAALVSPEATLSYGDLAAAVPAMPAGRSLRGSRRATPWA